jgi:hypothetical protein
MEHFNGSQFVIFIFKINKGFGERKLLIKGEKYVIQQAKI